MEKFTITTIDLTEQEFKLLKDCLDYVLHRIQKHGKPANINLQAVEKFKEELVK
jgi:hypothetical protein